MGSSNESLSESMHEYFRTGIVADMFDDKATQTVADEHHGPLQFLGEY